MLANFDGQTALGFNHGFFHDCRSNCELQRDTHALAGEIPVYCMKKPGPETFPVFLAPHRQFRPLTI